MAPWDDLANNQPTPTFSGISPWRELVPGRFMYELPHWRSELRVSRAPATIVRFTGRFGDSANTSAPGSPYGQLPARMRRKSDDVADPLPPQRASPSDFYQSVFDVEFLQKDNVITENVPAALDVAEEEQSTLDTLYRATGSSLPQNPGDTRHTVVMTHYHGPGIAQGFVFTGFNFWNFKRADCQTLVDFVLQELWHLSRDSSASRGATARR